MLLVQHVELNWTKISRGMPGAGKRNAVPTKFGLLVSPAQTLISLHRVKADESNDFQCYEEVSPLDGRSRYSGMRFVFDGAVIHVEFRYNEWVHGRPKRKELQGLICTLQPQTMVSLLTNGRFAFSLTGRRSTTYVEHRFHFWNADPNSASKFLQVDANRTIDTRVHLH